MNSTFYEFIKIVLQVSYKLEKFESINLYTNLIIKMKVVKFWGR